MALTSEPDVSVASRGDDPSLQLVPAHVAIIMDGNGRWARERGLSRTDGHRAGTENIRRILRTFADYGVQYLTLYAFSTENWERPSDEVGALMEILGEVIRTEARQLHAEGVRLVHIGRLDRLPREVRQGILDAIEMTKDNARVTVALAFDYGGRSEMIDAIKSIVAAHVPLEQINEDLIAEYLYTAGLPDPDLVIRTAGEMRLSNFLLWQAAYSEYYSTVAYWPDFDEDDVTKALQAYSQRRRKYGRVEDQEP